MQMIQLSKDEKVSIQDAREVLCQAMGILEALNDEDENGIFGCSSDAGPLSDFGVIFIRNIC